MSTQEAYKELFKNQKQRNIFIIFIAIGLIAVVAAGFVIVNQKNKNKNQGNVNVSLNNTPIKDTAPGQSNNPLYNQEVKNVNAKIGEESFESGTSFEPKLTNSSIESGSIIEDLTKVPEPVPVVKEEPKPVVEVAPPPVVTAAPVVPQVAQVEPERNKTGLYMLLSGQFGNRGTDIETDYTRKGASNANQTANNGSVSQNNKSSNDTVNESVILAKTGEMLNAILDTSINTDEPGPVLATIVGGPFDKSKVVCEMSANDQTTLVKCSKLNSPKLTKTIGVSLVAVDPNTQRTGLATSVDNHYFERYVIGLGAAFIKGYSEAIGKQNTVTIVNPNGGTTTTTGALTDRDIQNIALGEVGKTLADDVKKRTSNLKPTVKVNAGTAIGLIIMDDITIK